jgi:DNA-binding protein HU-beta
MNKKELVEIIAKKSGKSQSLINDVLSTTLETIMESVGDGEVVRLVGFGSFESVTRGARTGRNPKTNEVMEIPPRVMPRFRAGSPFKDALMKS